MRPTLAQDRNWSRSCRTAATHRDMVSPVTGDMSLPRPPPPLQLHHRRLALIMWEQEAATVGARWLSTGNPGTDAAAAGWFVSSLINTTQTAITRQTPGWGGTLASTQRCSRVMFDSWTQISNVRHFITVFLFIAAAAETADTHQPRDSCLHPRYPHLELLC